jgi:predicted SAM-dependent methyltransferase
MKLNLGCGTNHLNGWHNHDRDVDITKPLPFPTESATHIFIEHCVEHVSYHEAVRFFNEAFRVLRPGGVLRVTVPSIERVALSENVDYFRWVHKQGWAPTPDKQGAVHAMIWCHGHQMAWTSLLMRLTLQHTGFDDVYESAPGVSRNPTMESLEGHGKVIGEAFNTLESICFEGTKPGAAEIRNLNKDYDASFYHMHTKWQHEYDFMAELLCQYLAFDSCVDFGCGNGYLCRKLGLMGKSNIGVDGSDHVLKYFPDAIIRDLTQPLDVGMHDLAICTEVAEHIEEQYADTLVDTVCKAAGKHIFFSAAKPGFGGQFHVNEQQREYWYEKFEKRGFVVDHDLSQKICERLKAHNTQTWWFANNCFVLHRAGVELPTPTPKATRIAIVVGGAVGVKEELEQACKLCEPIEPEFYVVNDQIGVFPLDVYACTLHPDKLRGWLTTRHNNGLSKPLELWCHDGIRHHAPQDLGTIHKLKDWGGSSGLFAYQVARNHGHTKIIFCGVPMTSTPNMFRAQTWHAVGAFTRQWTVHRDEIAKYARSMSGWSAGLIGKPDEEWLR